ncbi:hypothetical protein [Streptomyces sp. NPDC048825]
MAWSAFTSHERDQADDGAAPLVEVHQVPQVEPPGQHQSPIGVPVT